MIALLILILFYHICDIIYCRIGCLEIKEIHISKAQFSWFLLFSNNFHHLTNCICYDSVSGNKLNVAVQVSDLENGSWESDRTFVVELDGARKAIQQDSVSKVTVFLVHNSSCLLASNV